MQAHPAQHRWFPFCDLVSMQAAVNPLNNLDLLMRLSYDFVAAVAVLEGLLERHQSRLPRTRALPEAQ